jgi:hypothetical protein
MFLRSFIMNKLLKSFMGAAAVFVFSITFLLASAGSALAQPVSFGTRSGNVVTYVNNTDETAQGYLENYNTGGKTATFTASSNAQYFSYGTHVTYTRMLKQFGTRYVWVYAYVFDGYNLWLNVPAHSTATVTGSI